MSFVDVVWRRLSADESLLNGHITPPRCEKCGQPLPAMCDCGGKPNACGRLKRFKSSRGALFDAPAALSCYVNTSRCVLRRTSLFIT